MWWKLARTKNDWTKVATGTWRSDGDIGKHHHTTQYVQKVLKLPIVRYATFEPRLVRYVRLSVFETVNAQNFVTINELEIFHIPAASISTVGTQGRKMGYYREFSNRTSFSFFQPNQWRISHTVLF